MPIEWAMASIGQSIITSRLQVAGLDHLASYILEMHKTKLGLTGHEFSERLLGKRLVLPLLCMPVI